MESQRGGVQIFFAAPFARAVIGGAFGGALRIGTMNAARRHCRVAATTFLGGVAKMDIAPIRTATARIKL